MSEGIYIEAHPQMGWRVIFMNNGVRSYMNGEFGVATLEEALRQAILYIGRPIALKLEPLP